LIGIAQTRRRCPRQPERKESERLDKMIHNGFRICNPP
jgi:hypothetical protein